MIRLEFVTLAEAKTHLRVVGAAFDADILAKISDASSVIADYLEMEIPEESPEVAPETVLGIDDIWTKTRHRGVIRAATLLALGDLFARREATGEGGERFGQAVEYVLSPTIQSILRRLREPSLA